jgi:hypothetical protein
MDIFNQQIIPSIDPFQIDGINSANREEGSYSSTDFFITLQIPPDRKFTKVVLDNCIIPKTWYNIQEGFNSFYIIENSIQRKITIIASDYAPNTLSNELINELNTGQPIGWLYTVTFPSGRTSGINAKFTFSVTGNSSQPSLYFPNTLTPYEQLGFDAGSTTQFSANSLTSPNVVFLQSERAIFLHSDIVNNPYSNILQTMFTSANITFSSIYFTQYNHIFNSRKYNGNNKNRFRFTLSDQDDNLISLNGNNWEFTIILW